MQSGEKTSTLRRKLQRPFFRYVMVGGSVYVFEVVVILLAQHLGAGPVLAVAISFALGTALSFGLQKLFTFGDTRLHHKIVLSQFALTCLLVAFNFGFTVLVTRLLVNVWPAICSRTLALLITTVWNFYLYKTHIFNKTKAATL